MDTLREIAYWPLGPFPVVFYLGLVSYALLLVTGAAMALPRRLKRRRPSGSTTVSPTRRWRWPPSTPSSGSSPGSETGA